MFFIVFGMRDCTSCTYAKLYLDNSYKYKYFDLESSQLASLSTVARLFGSIKDKITVPQIFMLQDSKFFDEINSLDSFISLTAVRGNRDIKYIGGYQDFLKYMDSHEQ